MGLTKEKGDLGVAMVAAEVIKRGYKVAHPFGEDWRYDLIVLRHGKLERVQCKYVESDGKVVPVKCRSTNNWVTIKYTPEDVDVIAVYDKTSDQCYFVPSGMLNAGRTQFHLRLTPPVNNQIKGILWAKDFVAW